MSVSLDVSQLLIPGTLVTVSWVHYKVAMASRMEVLHGLYMELLSAKLIWLQLSVQPDCSKGQQWVSP